MKRKRREIMVKVVASAFDVAHMVVSSEGTTSTFADNVSERLPKI